MVPNAVVEHLVEKELQPSRKKVLIVDDDQMVRETIDLILKREGFETVTASNVKDAIQLIGSHKFDVLLTDLHMPQAGDGLTVVSAMHHSNPEAVSLILSAFPAMKEAAAAILLQPDDILVKPLSLKTLADTIRERLEKKKAPVRAVDSVATILEDETNATIKDWLIRVDSERHILAVEMGDKERSAHLPQLFRDLVNRLRNPLPLGHHALVSPTAAAHGATRREQGYTAAMMVEESRMLQVSIFQTLQNNLFRVNFSLLLVGVMAIADEVDSQLAQAMKCYVAESKVDAQPVMA
jgi:YesN/AraC family two-component response regulator